MSNIYQISWVSEYLKRQFVKANMDIAFLDSRSIYLVSRADGAPLARLGVTGPGQIETEFYSHEIFSRMDISSFRNMVTDNKAKIMDAAKVLFPDLKLGKYNHAFTIAFSVDSDHDGESVTAEELLQALKLRVEELETTGEIIEAAGLPYDTFEN